MRHRFAQVLSLTALLICVGCGGDGDRLLNDLGSKDVDVRRAAAGELATVELDDPDVTAALKESTQDRDREVRRLACFALGERTDGLDELTAALEDPALSVQMAAAYALLKLEPDNEPATATLQQAMKSGDGGVIMAVSRQGADGAWAIPTLVELLEDDRPGIRRLAVEGLGHIGVATPQVLTALQRATKDRDDRVRESVTIAVNRINGVDE